MLLRFLFSFLSFFLFFFCLLSIVFSKKRNFFWQKIKNSFYAPNSKQNLLWFHAASVGEVELIKKITEKWKVNFFITTNTLGGLQQAKKFQTRSYIAPLDFAFSIKNWKKKMKAVGLILIEAEIWANMICVMAKNTPLAIINGRVENVNSFWNKKIYQSLLPKFSLLLASNQNVYKFYQFFTKKNLYHTGNIKFWIKKKEKTTNYKKFFPAGAWIFVAASLQPEEVPIILAAIKQVWQEEKKMYLVLIPRHPEKKVKFLQKLKGETFMDYQENQKITEKILLVSRLGVLQDWYQTAHSVFVGGSLCARGGQNMIEPLLYKKITATGYNTKNFQFAMKIFTKENLINVVKNKVELYEFIIKSKNNPRQFLVEKAPFIIAEQAKGFTQTIKKLKQTYSFLC